MNEADLFVLMNCKMHCNFLLLHICRFFCEYPSGGARVQIIHDSSFFETTYLEGDFKSN